MPGEARLGVIFLGRCDDEQLAWDLFWAAHRLLCDGKLEVRGSVARADAASTGGILR
jgi:hypothetical protein